jgi:predicted lipase
MGSPFYAGEKIDGATVKATSISKALLSDFQLYAQFCAAAYCKENNNRPGTKITCHTGNCPMVQNANVVSTMEFQNRGKYDATGFIAVDHTHQRVVTTIRGSASIVNFVADSLYKQVDASALCAGCNAEMGFWHYWQDIRDDVLTGAQQAQKAFPQYKMVVTGHSLGASVAVYVAAELRKLGIPTTLYTYGQPRVGNPALSTFVVNQTPHLGENFRITHGNDPIPQLPPMGPSPLSTWVGPYDHISPEYFIPSGVGNDGNITILEGDRNVKGNAGYRNKFPNILPHLQYFQTNLVVCGPIV